MIRLVPVQVYMLTSPNNVPFETTEAPGITTRGPQLISKIEDMI